MELGSFADRIAHGLTSHEDRAKIGAINSYQSIANLDAWNIDVCALMNILMHCT